MNPIETATDLWKQLQPRMHLRKAGRDNELYENLKKSLGCPPAVGLTQHLKTAELSAQDLLLAVLRQAAPFARMFHEIWDFLSTAFAPKSRESLRIRFGAECEFDLEQFREWSELTDQVMQQVVPDFWDNEVYSGILQMIRTVLQDESEGYELVEPHYLSPETNDLPPMPQIDHEFDLVVGQIHAHILHMLSFPRAELRRADKERWLADLYPGFCRLLSQLPYISANRKNDAITFYRQRVEPQIKAGLFSVDLKKPLDILNLPFWKERWHTYEIWATVATIKALHEYLPQVEVDGGYVALDGHYGKTVARLCAAGYPSACIVSQLQTAFDWSGGHSIRPDLSICFDETKRDVSRAVVVEFKQREQLSLAHVTEVGENYRDGSPNAAGVIILNYDNSLSQVSQPTLPEACTLFEEIQPATISKSGFHDKLDQLLQEAELLPLKVVAVLLDISISMGNVYNEPHVQAGILRVLEMPRVKVFVFNDEFSAVELRAGDECRIRTSGDTRLKPALRAMKSMGISTHDIAVITDGGFEEELVADVNQFRPDRVGDVIEWIRHAQG